MKKDSMTNEHKQALATGRAEGRAIRAYMEYLNEERPGTGRRGRPLRSSEELLALVQEEPDVMKRLQLRGTLSRALEFEAKNPQVEESLKADFIKVAASYSERNGLTYSDWREEGVPAAVLKQAGIR